MWCMTHCVITPFFATKIFVAKSHFSNEFAFHSKKKYNENNSDAIYNILPWTSLFTTK